LLLVDGGDLFFSHSNLGEPGLEIQKLRAETLVSGYNRLGTAGMTVGESDLAAGLPFLRSLAATATFPILSANLVDSAGEPVFKPYVIVERGVLKIALVGASSVMPPGDGYKFTDPLPALEIQTRLARAEADLVVLLFHGSQEDQQRIDAAGLPIDLILQSHLGGTANMLRTSTIPVARLGSEGRRLTALTLTLRQPGAPLVDLTNMQRTLTFVAKGIERLSRNQPKGVPLEEIYADNPQVLNRLALLRDRGTQAEAELARATNTLVGRRITLDGKVADDPGLLSLVNGTLRAVEALQMGTASGGR